MEPWKRVVTDDPILEAIQDNITPLMRVVEHNPINKGVLLKRQNIDGDTSIRHGLDRPPLGWIIVRRRSDVSVYDKQDENSHTSNSLLLSSSNPVTIDLWVF